MVFWNSFLHVLESDLWHMKRRISFIYIPVYNEQVPSFSVMTIQNSYDSQEEFNSVSKLY